jgi:hypothetical protein
MRLAESDLCPKLPAMPRKDFTQTAFDVFKRAIGMGPKPTPAPTPAPKAKTTKKTAPKGAAKKAPKKAA